MTVRELIKELLKKDFDASVLVCMGNHRIVLNRKIDGAIGEIWLIPDRDLEEIE